MPENAGWEIPVGERIRFFREAASRTRLSVANPAGITPEYLYQIERGLKVPSTRVIHSLARVLNVQVAALFPEPRWNSEEARSPWSTALGRAMVDVSRPDPAAGAPDLDGLRNRLTGLHTTYQQYPNRYSATAPLLPELVRDVGMATRAFNVAGEAAERREAFRLAADLYLLVRPVAKYLHRNDLMLMAADRAVFFAEAADDPVRMAAAQWNLAQALVSNNEPDNAQDVSVGAIEQLGPEAAREGTSGDDARAVLGSLHLVAAIAEVRQGGLFAARRRIRTDALPLARQVGERNAYWMVFGPANVQAHLVAVEMEAGEASEAIHYAMDLDVSALRSVERKASHLLALARCHDFGQDDAGTLLTLLRLEREAPEDVRFRGVARDLVRGLLQRTRPTFMPEVRELAGRMSLFSSGPSAPASTSPYTA